MGSVRPTKLFECHGARSLEYTPSGLFVSSRTNVTFVSHTEHTQTRVFRFNIHSSSIISVSRPVSNLVAYQSPKLFVCAYSVRHNKDVIKVPWEKELKSLCIFVNDKAETQILFSDSDGTWLTRAGSVPQKVNEVSFDHIFEYGLTVYASSGNTIYRLDFLDGKCDKRVVFKAPSVICKFQMRSDSEMIWTADTPYDTESHVGIYLSRLIETDCGTESAESERGTEFCTDMVQCPKYSKSSTAKAVSSAGSRLFYVENGFVMEYSIFHHVHSVTTVHSLTSSDSICRISSVEKCLYFADSTGIWRLSLISESSEEGSGQQEPQLQRRISVRQFEIDSSGYMYYTKKGIRGSLFRAICQEAEQTISSQQGLVQSFTPSDSYVFACCSSGRRQSTQLRRWNLYDTFTGSVEIDMPSISSETGISMCVDEDQHIVYASASTEIRTFSFDLNSLHTVSFAYNTYRMVANDRQLLTCSRYGIANSSLGRSILSAKDANFKEIQVIGDSMFMHSGSNIYKGAWIPRSQDLHAPRLVLSDISPMSVEVSWSGASEAFETVGIQLKKKTERQFKLIRESVQSPYSLQGLQEGTSYDLRLHFDTHVDVEFEASFTTPAATAFNCRALHQKLHKKNRSGQSVFDLTVDSESLAIVKRTINLMCNTGDRVRMRFRAQDRVIDAELHYVRNGEKFRLQEGSHNALLAFEQSRGSAQKIRLQSHDKRSETSIGYDESSNRIIVDQNSYGIGDTFFMHGRRVTVAQGSIVLMFANVVPDSFPYASTVNASSLGSLGGISTGTAILKSLYRVADRVTSDQTTALTSSYVKDSGETLEFSRISHLANETLDYGTFKISVLSTLSDATRILTDSVTCTPLGTTLVQNTVQSAQDVTNVISVTSDGISASSESFAIYFGNERQFRIKYTDGSNALLNIQYLKDGSYVTRAEFTST